MKHATKAKGKKLTRQQQRDVLLKRALARPGVKEVMEVYGGWQKADSGLDSYRSAVKEPMIVTTTNRANAW